MTVVSTIPGSPAEAAGLRADDAITAIDGSSVDGLTLDQAIAKVRGPKGTPVVLTIARAGGAPFDLRIVRATISQPQVEARDLENDTVRYIRVTTFSDSAATDFTAALQAGLAKGERSVIVDLRDNPGGYVTAARTIASQFIAGGPIFWEQSADGTQIETAAAPGGIATDPGIRVMVLVNKGSASASEIVAGALQDTKRGTLVGQTTFGKGTIQQWVDLTDDSGGFRLTIAKWLTPAKRWIHMKGLTPDILVGGRRRADHAHGRPVHRRGPQGPRDADRPPGVAARRLTTGGARHLDRDAADKNIRPGRALGYLTPAEYLASVGSMRNGGTGRGQPLARSGVVLYGFANRKEVMCSDRQ